MSKVSGEDPDYPATQLNVHSLHTKGWQSARFCEFPQEIVLEVDGNEEQHIQQVQLLSHQSKISTKIEIFVGKGHDYESAVFKRLGYLSLSNNERSGYQARELKTVYVDCSGRYMKLLIHSCFPNEFNMFNQVGIIAVNLLGPESEQHDAKSSSPKSSIQRIEAKGEKGTTDDNNGLDPKTAKIINQLADAKNRAVANEDYKLAKQIKATENDLKELTARLSTLDLEKRTAIKEEDYDHAAEIKIQTDEIIAEINSKIAGIPGFGDKPIPRKQQVSSTNNNNSMNNEYPDADSDPYENKNSNRNKPNSNKINSNGNGNGSNDGDGRISPGLIDDLPVGPAMTDDPSHIYRNASADAGPRDIPPRSLLTPRESDRPIKQGNRQQQLEDDGNGDGNGDGASPTVKALMREHLGGVPNIGDLPEPDEIPGKKRDIADGSGMTNLFGEFLTKCLFSKAWTLRVAALKKISLRMSEFEKNPGMAAVLGPVCACMKEFLDDKIAQVIEDTVELLEVVCTSTVKDKRAKSSCASHFDPIAALLIEKLGDGNARVRDSAAAGIECIMKLPCGCNLISSKATETLAPKQKVNFRLILGRIELLTKLLPIHGKVASSGLNPEGVMNFMKSTGAFSHSNGDVRDAAKACSVEVSKLIGTDRMAGYLKDLRPKQLEEYEIAFKEGGSGGGGGGGGGNNPRAAAGAGGGKDPKKGGKAAAVAVAKGRLEEDNDNEYDDKDEEEEEEIPPKKPVAKTKTAAATATTAPKSTTAAAAAKGSSPAAQPVVHAGEHEHDDSFTTCMFCGKTDKTWNEDALDLHYLRECPLLLECPACAQVIEITGFPEHQLDECEHKDTFVPCEVTGLAVLEKDVASWEHSPNCKAPPDGSMCCPLCFAPVVDSDDAWRKHLTKLCKKNTRIKK